MRVYFDYNATAPLRPEARAELSSLLFAEPDSGSFGNASSIHWAGREARLHLERARTRIAGWVSRAPSEVIFTSGGSEADNLALFGVARRRLIVSAVEHPAVREAAEKQRRRGVEVETIPVGPDGRIELESLERALAGAPALVSIMAANNEVGVIQPLDEVLRLAKAAGAIVHADAVQAAGRIELPLGADLISLSAHKLGGPKGIGALLSKKELVLEPEIVGGPQERGLRAGTESVALAAAFAAALGRALDDRDVEMQRLGVLRDQIDRFARSLDGVRILGQGAPRVAQTTTLLFDGVEAETLLHALDLDGVAASSGSACSSGSLEPSHVLLAMGVPKDRALGAVRFSMGWATRSEEVERLLEVLPQVLARARG